MTAWAVSLLGNPFGSTFEAGHFGELDVTARHETHDNPTKTNPTVHPHPGVTLYLTAEPCSSCAGAGCDACGNAGHLATFEARAEPTTEPAPALETTLAERALALRRPSSSWSPQVPFGSNTGPRVREYLAGCERGGHKLGLTTANWCAAFVGWCDAQAARRTSRRPRGGPPWQSCGPTPRRPAPLRGPPTRPRRATWSSSGATATTLARAARGTSAGWRASRTWSW